MPWTETCPECGGVMNISVQPPERRRHLPRGERPGMLSTTIDEWLCENGHFRELTYTEVRMLQ